MRYLPPVPWHLVAPGTVIMYTDGPRAVTVEPYGFREVVVHAEGLAPVVMPALAVVQPVELDESDAAATLHAADFTVTPIEEK